MARHEPRGQRALTLATPAPPCPVCADDRWVRLTGLLRSRLIRTVSRDVPCPVCNRHPDLPAVNVTADPKDVA